MNIISNTLKLNQGGGIPPSVSFVGVPSSVSSFSDTYPDTKKQEQDNPVPLLNEKMVQFLYENGIPSDVNKFLNESGLFTKNLFSNPFGNNQLLQYKTILSVLPKIKSENTRLQQAIKQAEDNDAIGEIAVTDKGYVFAKDAEGNIQKKRIQQVTDQEEILTNSDLISMRLNNPNAAFNTDLSNVIGNGIGLPKIQEYIKSVIDKLGNSVYSREGYASKRDLEILQGVKELQQGIFQTSTTSKSQNRQAELAINYLLTSLPKNMLTVLQANAAQRLGENSIQGVKQIISLLVGSRLSNEDSLSLKYDSALNQTATGKGKGPDLKAPEALLLGMGESQWYPINIGTADYMHVKGYSSMLTDKDGNSLAKGTLQDVMGGEFGSALDWNNISMGDHFVNTAQTNKIAIDGNKIVAADLPIDQEAARKGDIKPDMDMLRRKEEADRYIQDNNITDQNEINQIYTQKYQLPIMYDENGKLNVQAYKRFAVISGFADAKAFNDDAENLGTNPLLQEITDDNLYESVVSILKSADKEFSSSGGWLGTDTYQGSIYIPMVENFINTSLGSKNYLSLPNMNAMEAYEKEEIKKKRLEYKKPLSLANYEGK